ncbi:hypothetical protein OH738_40105 [Streptomyces hirsutus]|uniref:Uncharacterized protein n=1 Tax=Streptomyces hirsutus TaxID=35620 RepID=A0ABZ1GZ91_9ACTN|nr:hypothetical protein [Streptomyces hirsutus]WSD11210.1 hypothetical protein OIE73_39880 [Streptomyces hirsutus]WTD15435.1 hypothetical protein OH738_00075 [Streptomyces hirsutus]WTD22320.1 hypothetical protein OH738_40105 [Streptomyces hirsutus]
MNHTSPAFLLLALALAILFSTVIAAIAFTLARWDGATIPAALTRSGVSFATGFTLCLTVLSALGSVSMVIAVPK